MVRQSLPYGPEMLIENMWNGMPVHPMIDEMVMACVEVAQEIVGRSEITPHSTITLKFPSGEPAEIQNKVIRHVTSRLKEVQADPFYFDIILRSADWQLASTLTALYDLYFSLRGSTGKIVIEA